VPTTIVMVRHGETDWNRESRFQGHSDPPLNATGRAQAHELAETLRDEPITVAYTSPLRRAWETAQIVSGRLGVAVQTRASLMEVDVGSWSGLTRGEIEARFPDGYSRWLEYGHGWDDGESYDEFGERVVTGLLEIAGKHPEELVLAVTHGGPIRSALAAAARVSFREARRSIAVLENCTSVRIRVRDGIIERVD
jgi:2,3-bisphosphoglycerate-dependent phosphoglycerate mutase